MRRVYQVSSLSFLALSAFVVWEAHSMTYYSKLGPGPGFFPLWLGIVLALLSIAWFLDVSLRPTDPMEPGFVPGRDGIVRISLILASLIAYVMLVDTMGFRLTMLAFLLFLLLTIGHQRAWVIAIISIGGSFGVYYVFHQWLSVHLPKASLDFLRNLGL